MWVETLVFYLAAIGIIGSGLMVVLARNTVHAALFLVLTFICSSVLWMLLEAEFLALILVLVYVGAVMTLFLFVVMMLNLDVAPKYAGFIRLLPFGLIILAVFMGFIFYGLGAYSHHLLPPPPQPANYSNVSSLGDVLYTYYAYPFELAAVLLLIAIIAAISLSLRIPRGKRQDIKGQLTVKPSERLQLIRDK